MSGCQTGLSIMSPDTRPSPLEPAFPPPPQNAPASKPYPSPGMFASISVCVRSFSSIWSQAEVSLGGVCEHQTGDTSLFPTVRISWLSNIGELIIKCFSSALLPSFPPSLCFSPTPLSSFSMSYFPFSSPLLLFPFRPYLLPFFAFSTQR